MKRWVTGRGRGQSDPQGGWDNLLVGQAAEDNLLHLWWEILGQQRICSADDALVDDGAHLEQPRLPQLLLLWREDSERNQSMDIQGPMAEG